MTDQQQSTDVGPAVTEQVAVGPWRTDHVTPDTTYQDEPSEEVPPGWYVVRGPAELDPEVPCDAFGSIHVQTAVDSTSGVDIVEDVAIRIADMLNDLTRQHVEQRRHDQAKAVLFGAGRPGRLA